MPPLQDITHRFLSPLPPSSPALSYIDEVGTVEQNRTEPSSAFLALSTSSNAHARPGPDDDDYDDDNASDKENKENLPPFELGSPHAGPSNAVAFSTPTSKEARRDSRHDDISPPSSDPFGFLAVERKLKLERGQGKRTRREQEPEPSSKRQKLDLTTTTPSARVLPPPRVTPAKSILSPAKLKTQTPISRRVVDPRMLSPPAASPFYMQGRRRRRATHSFSDGDPLVDSHTSTPSPSKRREAPIHSPAVPNADEDNDINGENMPPSPTLVRQKPAVPKPKSKRKRVRIADVVDEDAGNQTLSALAHDPEMLAAVLQSRLPKRRVRQRTETSTKSKSKETRSRRNWADEETGEEGEEEEDKEETKRRSSRLAVRGSRAGNNKGSEEAKKSTDNLASTYRNQGRREAAEKVELHKTRKPVRKGKGKENAGRNLKPTTSRSTDARSKTKKPVSKGKEKEVDEEDSDDVKEKFERERADRRAYFEKLDSYELETENIYVI